MGILRVTALGAAGVVAYKLWRQQKAGTLATTSYDAGEISPPHGDSMDVAATPDMATSPDVSTGQSSRGFGET